VRALATWTKAVGITQGALFRHVTRHGEVKVRLAGRAVAEIVKRAAKDAGLVMAAAQAAGADVGTLERVAEHLDRAVAAGHGDLDMAATYLAHRPG
jgi:3-hydroxyisobutyrate dehydrogenase-like beta-hydroxyacid dehydrogenase